MVLTDKLGVRQHAEPRLNTFRVRCSADVRIAARHDTLRVCLAPGVISGMKAWTRGLCAFDSKLAITVKADQAAIASR